MNSGSAIEITYLNWKKASYSKRVWWKFKRFFKL